MSVSLGNFARRHCANYNTTNGCYLTEKVDWSVEPPKATAGPCLVAESKPCTYFKRAILPARDVPQNIRGDYYFIDSSIMVPTARTCPECGATLAPRQRFCQKCRRKRRLESYRQRKLKSRQTAPQLT